jgi:DNA-binding MarR family transcriptional regulator
MADRRVAVAQIAEHLPEIMRRLFGGRLIASGVWELTVPQLRALTSVAEREDCTMGELARSLGISLSAATGLAERLVQHGLLAREAAPEDRRIVCLRLTKAGERAREACRQERMRRIEAALGALSPRQQADIAAALRRLREALDATESAEHAQEEEGQ